MMYTGIHVGAGVGRRFAFNDNPATGVRGSTERGGCNGGFAWQDSAEHGRRVIGFTVAWLALCFLTALRHVS